MTPRAVNVGDFIARFGPLHPAHILLRPLLTTEQVECESVVLLEKET